MSYRLGVDVGGTFTDLLLVDEASGATWSAKVPSTPQDQSIGVLTGLERVCSKASISPKQIDQVGFPGSPETYKRSVIATKERFYVGGANAKGTSSDEAPTRTSSRSSSVISMTS